MLRHPVPRTLGYGDYISSLLEATSPLRWPIPSTARPGIAPAPLSRNLKRTARLLLQSPRLIARAGVSATYRKCAAPGPHRAHRLLPIAAGHTICILWSPCYIFGLVFPRHRLTGEERFGSSPRTAEAISTIDAQRVRTADRLRGTIVGGACRPWMHSSNLRGPESVERPGLTRDGLAAPRLDPLHACTLGALQGARVSEAGSREPVLAISLFNRPNCSSRRAPRKLK